MYNLFLIFYQLFSFCIRRFAIESKLHYIKIKFIIKLNIYLQISSYLRKYKSDVRFFVSAVAPPGGNKTNYSKSRDGRSRSSALASRTTCGHRQRPRGERKGHFSLDDIALRAQPTQTFPWPCGRARRNHGGGGRRSLMELFGKPDKSWVMDRWMWEREDMGRLSGDGEDARCGGKTPGGGATMKRGQDVETGNANRQVEPMRFSSEDEDTRRYMVEKLKTEIQQLKTSHREPPIEDGEVDRQERHGNGLEPLSADEYGYLPMRNKGVEIGHSFKPFVTADEIQYEHMKVVRFKDYENGPFEEGDTVEGLFSKIDGKRTEKDRLVKVNDGARRGDAFEPLRAVDNTNNMLEPPTIEDSVMRFPPKSPTVNVDMNRADQSEQKTGIGGDPAHPPSFPFRDEVTGTWFFSIHRLPGESLGMVLNIESSGGEIDPIAAVVVQFVQPGGAIDRAGSGVRSIDPGDIIVEVNGICLRGVSYVETVEFFHEMPLRVIMGVGRGDLPPDSLTSVPIESCSDDMSGVGKRNSVSLTNDTNDCDSDCAYSSEAIQPSACAEELTLDDVDGDVSETVQHTTDKMCRETEITDVEPQCEQTAEVGSGPKQTNTVATVEGNPTPHVTVTGRDDVSEDVAQKCLTDQLSEQMTRVACLEERIKQIEDLQTGPRQATQDDCFAEDAGDLDCRVVSETVCDSSEVEVDNTLQHWLQMLHIVVAAQVMFNAYGNIWGHRGELITRGETTNLKQLTCAPTLKSVDRQSSDAAVIAYVDVDHRRTSERIRGRRNRVRFEEARDTCDYISMKDLENLNDQKSKIRLDVDPKASLTTQGVRDDETLQDLEGEMLAVRLTEKKTEIFESVPDAGPDDSLAPEVTELCSFQESTPAWKSVIHMKPKRRKTFRRICRRRDAIAGSSSSEAKNSTESLHSEETGIPRGFLGLHVHFKKPAEKPLGLSIVKSYGCTSDYCQVSGVGSILLVPVRLIPYQQI